MTDNLGELFAAFAGVFTTTIDQQQQKVTVIGSVGVDILIRKLIKAGKHAEIWPENLTGKEKTSGKSKKAKEKWNTENVQNNSTEISESNINSDKNKVVETAGNCNGENQSSNPKNGGNSLEKPPSGPQAPAAGNKGGQNEGAARKSGEGGSGKKKKKKAQGGGGGGGSGSNGSGPAPNSGHAHTGLQSAGQTVAPEMGQLNLSPTRQQSYTYPDGYYPPMVYLTTYNKFYPMGRMGGPSYYVQPSPYTCAGWDQETYRMQSGPLVSFEIFSDENASGCFIM